MNKALSSYDWWKNEYPNDFVDNSLDCSHMQEYAEYYYEQNKQGNSIDWDELYRKYKEWYMTEPRSWQEAINVFIWMKEQIQNNEQTTN